MDKKSRNIGEEYGDNGRTNEREVDPDETVHVWHALLIETAQPRGALRVQSAVVLVFIPLYLFKDGARVVVLAFFISATTASTF